MASKLDPEWEQPKEELADLKKRLTASVELTQNKVGKWRKESKYEWSPRCLHDIHVFDVFDVSCMTKMTDFKLEK